MDKVNSLLFLPKYSHKLGLDRSKELLFKLKLNRPSFPWVHVAGTKGKGSTSVMLANILSASGYKTGLFLSPHLQNLNERISIGLKPISSSYLENILDEINFKISDWAIDTNFFEIMTILAFYIFSKEKVDIAFIETGLGGRLDATNSVENPIATVITTIGYDHTDRLGTTLPQIALEKAGIMKTRIPVFSANQVEPVSLILEAESKLLGSQLIKISDLFKIHEYACPIGFEAEKFSVFSNNSGKLYPNIELHLIGKHQIQNAVLSIAVSESLSKQFQSISSLSINEGLKKAFIPGRFEKIINPSKPNQVIILDGAHNEDSALALAATFVQRFNNKRLHILMAILKNKDIEKIISAFLPITEFFYFTTLPDHATYNENDYHDVLKKENKQTVYKFIENPIECLEKMVKEISDNDIICITGSLYLVGLIREYFHYPCSKFEQIKGGV